MRQNEFGDLPTHAYRLLARTGMTRAQVARTPDLDLLALPSLGINTLRDIRDRIPYEPQPGAICSCCGGTGYAPAIKIVERIL